MPSTFLMPTPKQHYVGLASLPLIGGKIYTYAAGGSVPKATFTDAAGTIAQPNPIVLNARGEPPNAIFWTGSYRVEIRDALGNLIYTVDNYQAPLMPGDLSASIGAGLIGFDYAAVYNAGTLGKWLQNLGNSTGSQYVGYSSATVGPGPMSVLARLRLEAIHIEEFPAVVANGIANDGPAIRAAIVACQAAGKMLVFGGTYAIDRITVQDAVYNFAMHSDNAQFTGIATSNQPGMFEIVNCVDFHMTGNWRLNVADNPNYEMGICVRVQAGTSQSTTRVNIYNPTIRNSIIGIGVGRYNVDFQCSEINVFGANFFKCPIGIYNAGANTGVQYIGCNIVSEANAAFPGAVEKAIWQEGGFIKVVGGSIFSNPTAPFSILQNPCLSGTYGNLYGTMNVAGAHVEVNAQLMAVVNSRALGAPVSDTSSFAFNDCAGFCGAPAAADFVFFGDPTYSGTLNIMNNNWYSAPVRTGYNISSASPTLNIVTDKKSMGKNFRNWMGGVFSGKMIHDIQPAMSAYGLSATYLAGSVNVLKFLTNDVTNELGRYGGNYNPATGIFSVPSGGFSRLDVRAGIAGSALANADFYIQKNGVIVAFGVWSGATGSINATLYNLVAGDQIKVIFTPYVNPSTSDAGVYNFMQLSAAT